MASKPQLTFARIVSGNVDVNGSGTGSVKITQSSVTTAVPSTDISATSTTITTTSTNSTTTIAATATASSELTDVSNTTVESGSQTGSITHGSSCGLAAQSVPTSSGKNKDGSHQRLTEERRPDPDYNASCSIHSGPHQQNQFHRRNKPRPKSDRLRKVSFCKISLSLLCL